MNAVTIRNSSVRGGNYHVYESPEKVRRSYSTGSRRVATPSKGDRTICYGDRVFVRLVRVQYGYRTLAEFTMTEVTDLSSIYGELRHYTRGERGLTRLYIRNVTRGWSMEQPFMLYSERRAGVVRQEMPCRLAV